MNTTRVVKRMMALAEEDPRMTPHQLAELGYTSYGEAYRAQLSQMDEFYADDLYTMCYCLDIRDEVDTSDRESAAEDLLCYCRKRLNKEIERKCKKEEA